MIRLICFDLGGVLVQICTQFELLLKRAQLEVNKPFEKTLSLSEIHQYPFFQEYQLGAINTTTYLEKLSILCESRFSLAEMLALHQAILVDPYPQTMELILHLHTLGYLTACLSNTNDAHFEVMTKSDRFPNVKALQKKFASHQLKLEKPDPRIYQTVEETCQLLPEAICYFDDSEIHVEAAKKRGWSAFVMDPQKNTASQMEAVLTELQVLCV